MNAQTQRTPGPWAVETYGSSILISDEETLTATIARMGCTSRAQADAAFIVTACNAHDELVAALRGLLENPPITPKGHGGLQHVSRDAQAAHQMAVNNARAALAKVTP